MKIKARTIEVHISPLIIIVFLILAAAGYLREYCAAFFSIALHEIGHIIAAKTYGYKTEQIKITPIGFSASIDARVCSETDAAFIYLAGPFVNLIIFAAASIANVLSSKYQFWQAVATTNIFLALFNLIPAIPLDGGRVLFGLLAKRVGLIAADRNSRKLAIIFSIILLLLGAYQFYITNFNFSLIIIGICIIIFVGSERMESALMNIRQILYRRSKLVKNGVYPSRGLVVLRSTRLNEAIKKMDFDRFHIVHVLDDNLCLQKSLTENEIMDAITKDGENVTFAMLLERNT